jgi:ArsR family transcriptional regulator, arsenate/arsenite/antimonite-responsive transcriptional repressor
MFIYTRGKNMDLNYASIFKALSDENRLKILELLIKGETCGCTLIHKLPITQPTLSYHLKALTEVGLTIQFKEGTWVKHHVNKDTLDQLIKFLIELKEANEACNL